MPEERDGIGVERGAADDRPAAPASLPVRYPVYCDRLSFNTTLTRVTQSLSLQIHTTSTTGCGVCIQSTG